MSIMQPDELIAMRRLVLYMREEARIIQSPLLVFIFEMAYEELRHLERDRPCGVRDEDAEY